MLNGQTPVKVADPPCGFTNLKRDTAYHVAGSVLCSALMLAMNLVAARVLGRIGYGNFGSLQTFAIWCAILFSFGGPMTLTLLAGRAKHHRGAESGMVYFYVLLVVIGTSLAVCFDYFTGALGFVGDAAPSTLAMLVIYAGLLAFFDLFTSFLRGSGRFGLASLAHLGQAFALAIGVVIGAYLWRDHIAALWSGSAIALVLVIVITVMAVRNWGMSFSNLNQAWQLGRTAGARSYIVAALEIGAETFAILYLTRLGDFASVAAIIACQRISTIFSKPAAIISMVLFAKVAGGASGPPAARMTLQIARMTFLMALIPCIFVLPFIRFFTELALGTEFVDVSPVMALFLVGVVCRGHASAAVGFLLGQGCPKSYVILKFCVLLASIAGTIVLYPAFGALGVAFVYAANSLILMVGIAVSVVRRAESVKALFIGNEWQQAKELLLKLRTRFFKQTEHERGATMNTYRFDELPPGTVDSLDLTVTKEAIQQFAELSGDVSPVHVDAGFAKARGYTGQIAHGALLTAYVSRFIGVHLPGSEGVLQRLEMQFRKPCYAGTRIRITGEVTRQIESVNVVIIKITVIDAETGDVLANGQVQSGIAARSIAA